MAEKLKGNVLLTGAAGGMGTAMAKTLVEAGYSIVLLDRDERKLTETGVRRLI